MKRAMIVTVETPKHSAWTPEERALELRELALSAGIEAVDSQIVNRSEIDPAYFIGSGKVSEIADLCKSKNISIVIFNNDLSPSQSNNIEEIVRASVIDRTQLILDIFARRAHSNEGKLQVELARLKYVLPRLIGKGVSMSRLGGGIGTSGPGEQKLEMDRRRIREKIAYLSKELLVLGERRQMMRKNRDRFSALTIAIVGYTNAGKSTLMNALTNSDVFVEDKLFATLDPTIRKYVMPNNQKVLFIDTVGFIKELPHHLVEAFKATLEEVAQADLILHLVDAHHVKALEQAEAVDTVLKEINAGDKPRIIALNKSDIAEDNVLIEKLKTYFKDAVMISALKKEGFDELIAKILKYVQRSTTIISITIPSSDVKTLHLIHENGFIIKEIYDNSKVCIEAEVSIKLKEMIEKIQGRKC